MQCPNFETCGGEMRFSFSPVSQGEGPWSLFVGYEAELEEQTCECKLTDEQVDELHNQAVECFEVGGYVYYEP